MTWFRCGGGGSGIPAALKNRMNAVLNKKFGTTVDYPPNGWPDDVNLLGELEEKTTAAASICSFDDGADDVPTKSLVVTIPPTLSGVSSVTETQTGRNLFDNTGLFPVSGSVSSYYFKQFDVSSGLIPEIHLKEGVTYTFAVDVTSTIEPFNFSVGCGNGSYSSDILTVYNKSSGRISITFTPTAAQLNNGDIFAFMCPRYPAQNTFDYSISNVQLEYGSTAHDYEQYDPTTYTANLGRTIYGGTADVVNGEGQETYGEPWTWTAGMSGVSVNNNGVCYINKSDVITVNASNQTTLVGCICSDTSFESRTWAGLQNATANGCSCVYGNGIAIKIPSYTTKEDYEAYLANNPLTFVYMLKTPTDFTFTGQEIPTRLGVNNFWSDSGDTEVTYRGQGTVTPVLPTLISKTITENGSYQAADDQADGYSEVIVNVSGGSCERLLYLRCVNNDQIEIPAASSITQGAKYSQYVSYDSTTKKFTVLQDFTAIIIAWVYTYQTYESSRSDGALYINNSQVIQYEANGTAAGSTGGVYLSRNFKQNDTFNVYTPMRDGYPQQNLKIYLLADVPDNIYTFTDENA